MCGIAAMFSYSVHGPPVDVPEILRIRERMASRGPDGEGLWVSPDRRVALAHRRLAIIDLSPSGAQPMATADGRLQIVFNGEIYNYRELRDELRGAGVEFRSHSDTEVLLQLYLRDGEAMCRRLRGMYAFAIWDDRTQSLFVVRDPFGIKPMYLHDDGQTIRVASTVKSLLAGGSIPAQIDPAGEAGYWVWGHVPEPQSICRGIRSLEPGTWMRVGRAGYRSQATFESVAAMLTEGASDGPEALHDVLLDSVRHHLVSDVPVGIFLSSGIDSTAITSLASECGANLRTVTLGFEEFRGTSNDETDLARKVAERFGAHHDCIWIGRREFEQCLDEFLHEMDQPTIDGLNSWLVSRAAAKMGLKVALSGLGGDELFGGYPSFAQVPLIRYAVRPFGLIPGLGRAIRRISTQALGMLTGRAASWNKHASMMEYGGSWDGAYMLRRAVRMPWELPEPLRASFAWQASGSLPGSHLTVMEMELTRYMRNQLLRDCDWSGMAHSLEIRVPFLDKVVARAVGRKARSGVPWRKSDVALAARDLPSEVRGRRKTGFVVPVREWAQSHAGLEGHGLRPWQAMVLAAQVGSYAKATPEAIGRQYALWAPEMASAGGVQRYMWRLWEVLTRMHAESGIPVSGLTLLDTTGSIAAWPNVTPPYLRPEGAGRSKVGFVVRALSGHRQTDVIVGHLHIAPIALAARLMGRLQRYVVVLHGIEAWHRRPFLERVALRHATCVIATTRYTAQECASANGIAEGKFRILPLCVEASPAKADPTFELDGEWPLLFVARLAKSERYKGLEHVIEAVAALRRRSLDIKLHVVGSGDDMPYYEELANRLGLDHDGLRFHGQISDSSLESAYRTARAFVMPSAKEGFGIVFLEAMRNGVPCIGGAHGGTPEVFRDGEEGLLVPFGDIDALTRHLERLASDFALQKRLSNGGRERFLRDYTFEAFAGRWQRMLAGNR